MGIAREWVEKCTAALMRWSPDSGVFLSPSFGNGHVPIRVLLKFFLTALRTEIIPLVIEIVLCGSRVRVNAHSADLIMNDHGVRLLELKDLRASLRVTQNRMAHSSGGLMKGS